MKTLPICSPSSVARYSRAAALLAACMVVAPALSACDEAPEKPSASASQSAVADAQVTVPDVVSMKVDQARSALSGAGLTGTVNLKDVKGVAQAKKESEWSVVSQTPAAGEKVAAAQGISLVVRNDVAEAEASASAAAQAAAEEQAAEEKAEQERLAQEQAVKKQTVKKQAAKKQAVKKQAAKEPAAKQDKSSGSRQVQPFVGGGDRDQSGTYYSNCKEARKAGAAPLYRGEPGYREGLDRDHDGIACEK